MLQKLEKIQQDLEEAIEEYRKALKPVEKELEILLCPWCNLDDNNLEVDSEPIATGDRLDYWVSCVDCGARGPRSVAKEGAIYLWNDTQS